MNVREIHVGGVYRIRQWDDMVEEFGEEDGEIPCSAVFTESMSHLCGESVRVTDIGGWCDGEVSVVYLDVEFENWTITADMLEPYVQEEEYEEELPDVDPASIFYLLGG